MASQILLLGHDKDYYGADTRHESIASAVHKAFETPRHLSHGAACLEYLTDCSVVIPAGRVYSYGAPFAKDISASVEQSLADRLDRLFQELLVEADSHHADYVLVQSLEIRVGHFAGGEVTAWAQMMNAHS
jgi:hypothetical protein